MLKFNFDERKNKCEYFVEQYPNEKELRKNKIDLLEQSPILIYCTHPLNNKKTEGNCKEENCPILLKAILVG